MFSEKRSNVLHGILLIALFSCSAFYIAEFPFVKNLSFSPLIVGILLGMVYANSLRNHLPETWARSGETGKRRRKKRRRSFISYEL